jgi:hypothetical protein
MNSQGYQAARSIPFDRERAVATPHAEPGHSFGRSRISCAGWFFVALTAFIQLSLMPLSGAGTMIAAEQTGASGSRAAQSKPPKVDFKVVKIFNGKTTDGTWTAMFKMLGSNGHVVWKLTIPYGTVPHADSVIQGVVKQADEIIRTSHEVDERGVVREQRILMKFPVRTPADHRFRLIWRSGSSLHEIEGDTLQDVLDLEAYLNSQQKKQAGN